MLQQALKLQKILNKAYLKLKCNKHFIKKFKANLLVLLLRANQKKAYKMGEKQITYLVGGYVSYLCCLIFISSVNSNIIYHSERFNILSIAKTLCNMQL